MTGSGVVEAACKTLVAQRLTLSGMRWGTVGNLGKSQFGMLGQNVGQVITQSLFQAELPRLGSSPESDSGDQVTLFIAESERAQNTRAKTNSLDRFNRRWRLVIASPPAPTC